MLNKKASANTGNPNNSYNVSSGGASSNNNANNTYGVAHDLEEKTKTIQRIGVTLKEEKPLFCEGSIHPTGVELVNVPVDEKECKQHSASLSTTGFFTLESLIDAVNECSREVAWKDSVLKWKIPSNKLRFCNSLLSQLEKGEYKLGKYSKFHVYEPKKREISSPIFRDRVVQRAMCNLGVYDDLTKSSIYDSCACLKRKGTDFAIKRLKTHLQKFHRKHGKSGWILKLDIHHFFESIPHAQLKEKIAKTSLHPNWKRMIGEIIDSFKDPGIGLGSQLSQLLAMFYLSDLDHFIKEELKVEHYIRYSDDMVLIHEDYEETKRIFQEISKKLKELGLELNPKSCYFPIKQGVYFLKWKFSLTDTGGVVMKKSKASISRFKRFLISNIHMNRKNIESSFQSWESHMKKGNSYREIEKMRRILDEQRSKGDQTGRTGKLEEATGSRGEI